MFEPGNLDVTDLKRQLNIDASDDDTLLQQYLQAAEAHLSKVLGYSIFEGDDEPRQDLVQAVLMLAAHWYENREASLVGVTAQEVPFGVMEIIRENRDYTFG